MNVGRMTSNGRNHGRGRGRGRSVAVDSGVDYEFRPDVSRYSSNVKDDGVQDSNFRVPTNRLDEASIGVDIADGYNQPRRSEHGQTSPKREANSSSKCPQSATLVGSSYRQIENTDGYYHHIRSQHGPTLPKKEANSSSKCTQSVTMVGSSYQQIEGADGYYLHKRSQHGQTLPKREANSSLKCTQSDTVVGSSYQQIESADGYFPHVRSQHGQTLPKRVVKSSSKFTQSATAVSSWNQQVESADGYHNHNRSQHQAPGKTHHGMRSSEEAADNLRAEQSERLLVVPFDICQSNKAMSLFKLQPSLLVQNREKKKELECVKRSEKLVLRQGMVLLKKYISHTNQIEIIKKCRELGLGPGGFYQPGYRDGAKLHLQMMCLGKIWDPQFRSYGDRRSIDDAPAPGMPFEFRHLVEEAIQESHSLIKQKSKLCNVQEVLPVMSPDICIANFYTENGKLGLHQDRDESKESLQRGLPVVSFSIGDSAEFLYGDTRDTEQADRVILDSGDVLLFGGNSRHVFHGVKCIIPNSAPSFLVEEANLRPGRLNLTFRQS